LNNNGINSDSIQYAINISTEVSLIVPIIITHHHHF